MSFASFAIGSNDDVVELARQARRELLAAIDREGERVRRLVDPEMVALQLANLLRANKRQSELALVDPLRSEHVLRKRNRTGDVQLGSASVHDLDVDHPLYFRRCVPVSSACSLYAST